MVGAGGEPTGQIGRTNEQVDRLIELQEKEYVRFPKSRSKRQRKK